MKSWVGHTVVVRKKSNKALQRRPRSAVLTRSFDAIRGPAERGRYAARRAAVPWAKSSDLASELR
jgi:hypothetical protein